jgi:hypothetical protein
VERHDPSRYQRRSGDQIHLVAPGRRDAALQDPADPLPPAHGYAQQAAREREGLRDARDLTERAAHPPGPALALQAEQGGGLVPAQLRYRRTPGFLLRARQPLVPAPGPADVQAPAAPRAPPQRRLQPPPASGAGAGRRRLTLATVRHQQRDARVRRGADPRSERPAPSLPARQRGRPTGQGRRSGRPRQDPLGIDPQPGVLPTDRRSGGTLARTAGPDLPRGDLRDPARPAVRHGERERGRPDARVLAGHDGHLVTRRGPADTRPDAGRADRRRRGGRTPPEARDVERSAAQPQTGADARRRHTARGRGAQAATPGDQTRSAGQRATHAGPAGDQSESVVQRQAAGQHLDAAVRHSEVAGPAGRTGRAAAPQSRRQPASPPGHVDQRRGSAPVPCGERQCHAGPRRMSPVRSVSDLGRATVAGVVFAADGPRFPRGFFVGSLHPGPLARSIRLARVLEPEAPQLRGRELHPRRLEVGQQVAGSLGVDPDRVVPWPVRGWLRLAPGRRRATRHREREQQEQKPSRRKPPRQESPRQVAPNQMAPNQVAPNQVAPDQAAPS